MNLSLTVLRTIVNHNRYKFRFLKLVMISKHVQFHNSPICLGKMYMEHENQYAYGIMENKGYAKSIKTNKSTTFITEEEFQGILKGDCAKKSSKEIFEEFSLVADYCSEKRVCISNTIFDDFIDCLTDNVRYASDHELQNLFYSLDKFPETKSVRTRNFIEIWAALDDECFKRHKDWPYDQMLLYLSLFYMLNVTRASDFTTKCLQRMTGKAKRLSPSQLVQTMFFIGVLRKQPFDMHNLEIELENNFNDLTIDDLAIMSMGFFKSKTPIRSMDIMLKIVDKIIENRKEINEVSLAALVKIIRYSMKMTFDNRIYRLLDALQHEVPRLSFMCNVHIALLGTATLTFHKECLTTIAEASTSCLSEARLKDLERLVLSYGTFNFNPPAVNNFINKIMDELRKPERQQEIDKYGRCFASCVSYMSLLEKYPVDLMSKALDPEFMENTYGKQPHGYGRELLTIHNTSLIFCGEAEMNRLSDKAAMVMAKKYTDYIPDAGYSKQYNVAERMFLDVYKIISTMLGGDEFLVADHILTHHQRGDIILCYDCNNRPVPVHERYDQKTFGFINKPPDNNLWIVLVIAGRNGIIHNTDTPAGPFLAKIRELRKLGYHAAMVPWSKYYHLKTNEEKISYLEMVIQEAVNT